MLKSVLLVAPASEREPIRTEIAEGVTVQDVLDRLKSEHNITASVLQTMKGETFTPDEELWPKVEPGQKLLYMTSTTAGDGSTVVRPSFRSLHVERGWVAYEGGWTGWFRARGRRFGGDAVQISADRFQFHCQAPEEIKRHPKFPCFRWVGEGWYFVNFAIQPRSLDEGIAYIERLLTETLTPGTRRVA